MVKTTIDGEHEHTIEYDPRSSNTGLLDNSPFSLDIQKRDNSRFHVIREARSYNVEILKADHTKRSYRIRVNGTDYEVKLQDRYDALLEQLGMAGMQDEGEANVKAPMPGKVLDIMIEKGQAVGKDQPLLVLEAMKMENVLKAPADGVIKEVFAETSKSVEKDQILIELEK